MPTDVTIEDLLAVLADGAVDELDLLEATGVDLDDPEATRAALRLLHDPRIVRLFDGRVADGRVLLDGLVLWHRLTEAEAHSRTIELDRDVIPLAVAVADPLTATVGEQRIDLRVPVDEDGGLDDERGPLLDLPDGWGDDLDVGDLVGFTAHEDHLGLVVGPTAAEVPDEVDHATLVGLAQALDGVGEHLRDPLLLAADPDDPDGEPLEGAWVLHLDDAATTLLVDHGGALRALDRPLAEVVEAAGLRVDEDLVLGPDVTDEDLLLYLVGWNLALDAYGAERPEPGVSEAIGLAWLGLDGDLEAVVMDDTVALALSDPFVAGVIAHRITTLDAPELDAVLDRVRAVAAVDPAGPGVALVLAEALDRTGDLIGARDVLAAAAGRVPDPIDWSPLHARHGDLSAYAGDVAAARSAYDRIGDQGEVDVLDRWVRPVPPGVGRNDRCPCGSGRKHKQCCLRHPRPLDLDARVGLLWWKLRRAAVHAPSAIPPSGGIDALPFDVAIDAHLVEDGGLAAALAAISPLLPDDERELADTWGDLRRGVHRVVGVTGAEVELEDVAAGTTTTAVLDPADPRPEVGDLWLAVLAPGPGGRPHVVGAPVALTPSASPIVVETLRSDPTAHELTALLVALADRG